MLSSFRVAVLLALCLPAAFARADSWLPPRREVYTSADGATRLTVDPRPIEGALAYFSDKVDDKSPAGQPAGEAQTAPMAHLERQDAGGQWRTVWRQPLVNDVAPVEAVVANGGARVATFDNWHSMGLGEDAVVIYDEAGKPLRKLSLEQLLPADYIAFLPHSVSSLHWRGDATVSADGQWLEIRVREPQVAWAERTQGTVPVRIRLGDGAVQAREGDGWAQVHARLVELRAQRQRDWQQLRAQRAQPLLPPTGDDAGAWREYLVELRDRLNDEEQRFAGTVLQTHPMGFMDDEDGARDLVGMLGDRDMGADRAVIVSPDSARLTRVLAKALKRKAKESCRGALLVALATAEEFGRLEQAATPCGLQLRRLDAAEPVPGETLPEAAPEYFLGTPPRE